MRDPIQAGIEKANQLGFIVSREFIIQVTTAIDHAQKGIVEPEPVAEETVVTDIHGELAELRDFVVQLDQRLTIYIAQGMTFPSNDRVVATRTFEV